MQNYPQNAFGNDLKYLDFILYVFVRKNCLERVRVIASNQVSLVIVKKKKRRIAKKRVDRINKKVQNKSSETLINTLA